MARTRDEPNASPREARKLATRRRRDREIEIRVLYCVKENGKVKAFTNLGDGDETVRMRNRTVKSLIFAGEDIFPAIYSGNDCLTFSQRLVKID